MTPGGGQLSVGRPAQNLSKLVWTKPAQSKPGGPVLLPVIASENLGKGGFSRLRVTNFDGGLCGVPAECVCGPFDGHAPVFAN
jgi:hypothetical protein